MTVKIEKGEYRAKCKTWALGASQNGTERLECEFELLDMDGLTMNWEGYLSEAAFLRTQESMKHMGWAGDWEKVEGLDKCEVSLAIEDETYLGKTRSRVRWVNRAKLPEEAQKTLGQRMKERAAALAAKKDAPSAPVAAAQAQEEKRKAAVAADDIPF